MSKVNSPINEPEQVDLSGQSALKTMNQIIYLVLGLVWLSACSLNGGLDAQLKLTDSVEFKTGFAFHHKPSGKFYSKELGEQCYYFGDLSTTKRIKGFNSKGKELFSIPLNKIFWLGEGIDDVDIWSLDTILVLSQYTNKLYFLNHQGEIWKKLDLNEQLQTDSLWRYELSSSYYSKMFFNRNSLVLSLNSGLSSKGNELYDEEQFTNQYWRMPQLVSIQELFSDSIRLKKGFELYREIAPQDSFYFNTEVKSFLLSSESVYAHSVYSNKLFQLDASSLSIKAVKSLSSEHTTIGSKKVGVQGKTLSEVLKEVRQRWQTGYISAHFFNEHLMQHYVIVAKETSKGFYEANGFIPWVLLVCNEKMDVVKELNFDDGRYTPFLIPTNSGFLLQKSGVEVNHYNEQKMVFHEMEY